MPQVSKQTRLACNGCTRSSRHALPLWRSTCQAMASSSARAMCAALEEPVRPKMAPRASGRQCGASSPLNAGTKNTPAQQSTHLHAGAGNAKLSCVRGAELTPPALRSPSLQTASSKAACAAARFKAGCLSALTAPPEQPDEATRTPAASAAQQPQALLLTTTLVVKEALHASQRHGGHA